MRQSGAQHDAALACGGSGAARGDAATQHVPAWGWQGRGARHMQAVGDDAHGRRHCCVDAEAGWGGASPRQRIATVPPTHSSPSLLPPSSSCCWPSSASLRPLPWLSTSSDWNDTGAGVASPRSCRLQAVSSSTSAAAGTLNPAGLSKSTSSLLASCPGSPILTPLRPASRMVRSCGCAGFAVCGLCVRVLKACCHPADASRSQQPFGLCRVGRRECADAEEREVCGAVVEVGDVLKGPLRWRGEALM